MINRRQFQTACAAILGWNSIHRGLPSADIRGGNHWHQWGGPNRDFQAAAPGTRWEKPPRLVWERSLGPGHSAIVTDGDSGYSVHLDGDDEVVERWELETGTRKWQHRTPVAYHAFHKPYDGPHSTPLIQDHRIVTVSIDAQVQCFDTRTGKRNWAQDLKTVAGTRLPQSGYASSPIVWKKLLILPTLGESSPRETETYRKVNDPAAVPGAIALDLETGQERWRSESFRSSHSSPICIEVDGQPMLVFHGMFELVGVDPRDGSILWRHLLRREAADNVSFTPIWDAARQQILISHGYCDRGTQAIRLKLQDGKWETARTWTNRQLRIVHTNAVLHEEWLIGTNREPTSLMVGIDVREGKTVFRRRGFPKANLIQVGSRVAILGEDGKLTLSTFASGAVTTLWEMSVFEGPTKAAWTPPTPAGDLLLVRNDRELRAYRF